MTSDRATADTFNLTTDGRMSVQQTVRDNGVVAYRLTGVMRGTIVFVPDVRDDEAVPSRVTIRFGDGDGILATALLDLPIMGTTSLIGGGDRIDFDDPGWTRRLDIAPRESAVCPTATATSAIAYARWVCINLAKQYRQLNQGALAQAAAGRTANRRLGRCVHQQILPGHRLLIEDQDELAGAWTLAEQLQELSPLRLLPADRAGCAWELRSASTRTPTSAAPMTVTG